MSQPVLVLTFLALFAASALPQTPNTSAKKAPPPAAAAKAPVEGKPVDHIDYVDWSGPGMHWSAKIADDGMGWIVAPEGDWKRARPAVIINYFAPNGTEWMALIQDGRFTNSANGAGVSFLSSEMSYRGWDGTNYSIRLDLKNKRFLQEVAQPVKPPAAKPAPAKK